MDFYETDMNMDMAMDRVMAMDMNTMTMDIMATIMARDLLRQ